MASPARRRQASPVRPGSAAAVEGIDFEAIAEATLDVILCRDTNGVATHVSPSIVSLIGRTPEDTVGRRHVDLIHVEAHRARLTDGRAAVRMMHKDGSNVWVEGSGRMLTDPATGAVSSVLVPRDIAKREALEARLSMLALADAAPPTDPAPAEGIHERGIDKPRERQCPPRCVN